MASAQRASGLLAQLTRIRCTSAPSALTRATGPITPPRARYRLPRTREARTGDADVDRQAEAVAEGAAEAPIVDSPAGTLYRRRRSRCAPPVQFLSSRTQYHSITLLRRLLIMLFEIVNALTVRRLLPAHVHHPATTSAVHLWVLRILYMLLKYWLKKHRMRRLPVQLYSSTRSV